MDIPTMPTEKRAAEAHRLLDYLESERGLNVWEGYQVILMAMESMGAGMEFRPESERKNQ